MTSGGLAAILMTLFLELTRPRARRLQADRLRAVGEETLLTLIQRDEQEISLRLLRHLASSVRHQQYHDTDVVTVRVEPPAAA